MCRDGGYIFSIIFSFVHFTKGESLIFDWIRLGPNQELTLIFSVEEYKKLNYIPFNIELDRAIFYYPMQQS